MFHLFKLQGSRSRAQKGQRGERAFIRRSKSGHFLLGKERTCSSSGCHDVRLMGFELPMPALGLAVLASTERRREGKKILCEAGSNRLIQRRVSSDQRERENPRVTWLCAFSLQPIPVVQNFRKTHRNAPYLSLGSPTAELAFPFA